LRTKASAGGSRSGLLTHVDVEITDTGEGMDEETRGRCLEPFFSTKGERGTGLGLAMVFGMTERHNAEISIESELRLGTTIGLHFPLRLDQVTPSAHPSHPTMPPRMRILLIDDDPLILKSLQDALEHDGHVVVTANGGWRVSLPSNPRPPMHRLLS
jgi:hypothetical protein